MTSNDGDRGFGNAKVTRQQINKRLISHVVSGRRADGGAKLIIAYCVILAELDFGSTVTEIRRPMSGNTGCNDALINWRLVLARPACFARAKRICW
jgi:hypothetical protein